MFYVDAHIHMVARTTDDYVQLARTGCVAVAEPAFWAGFDRTSAASFYDYFRHIVLFEPKRAAQYGIHHFCWLCINAKEAEDVGLSREVVSMIPQFLDEPGVLGIGEAGLNKNTINECQTFLAHIELAAAHDQMMLVHTPHLEDKYQGTRMILDMIADEPRIKPSRVLIDHAEEHTVKDILDAGFWCGLTLYPGTKCTPERAVDIIERYGSDRMIVDTSGDWGPSLPMNLPDFVAIMRARGHSNAAIHKVVYDNPLKFMAQSANFNFEPPIPIGV